MNEPLQEIEGTWEEVAAHEAELRGRQVKLLIVDSKDAARTTPDAASLPRGSDARIVAGLRQSPLGADTETHLKEAAASITSQRPEPTLEQARLGILPAVGGARPVLDVDVWLASLPRFDGSEVEYAAFEAAIAENRARRRQMTQEQED